MKMWLGRMRGYWQRWNQVDGHQVSYEDDRLECDSDAAIETSALGGKVVEIDRIHQFS